MGHLRLIYRQGPIFYYQLKTIFGQIIQIWHILLFNLKEQLMLLQNANEVKQSTPALGSVFTMCDSTWQNGLVTRFILQSTCIKQIKKGNVAKSACISKSAQNMLPNLLALQKTRKKCYQVYWYFKKRAKNYFISKAECNNACISRTERNNAYVAKTAHKNVTKSASSLDRANGLSISCKTVFTLSFWSSNCFKLKMKFHS